MNKDKEYSLEEIEKELKDLSIDPEKADYSQICPHNKHLIKIIEETKAYVEDTPRWKF